MSRAPPALARRLDRLARGAHRFHRFAHHPLCPSYAGEVIRLGRRAFVCRGCALAGTGGLIGALAGLALPRPPTTALLGAGGLLVAAMAYAAASHGAGKVLRRALPLALAVALAGWGIRAGDAVGLGALAATAVVTTWAWLTYRRRGPDRAACLGCPERAGPETCSGFRHVVRREAAYRRAARRLLGREAPPPTGTEPALAALSPAAPDRLPGRTRADRGRGGRRR